MRIQEPVLTFALPPLVLLPVGLLSQPTLFFRYLDPHIYNPRHPIPMPAFTVTRPRSQLSNSSAPSQVSFVRLFFLISLTPPLESRSSSTPIHISGLPSLASAYTFSSHSSSTQAQIHPSEGGAKKGRHPSSSCQPSARQQESSSSHRPERRAIRRTLRRVEEAHLSRRSTRRREELPRPDQHPTRDGARASSRLHQSTHRSNRRAPISKELDLLLFHSPRSHCRCRTWSRRVRSSLDGDGGDQEDR